MVGKLEDGFFPDGDEGAYASVDLVISPVVGVRLASEVASNLNDEVEMCFMGKKQWAPAAVGALLGGDVGFGQRFKDANGSRCDKSG